MKRFQKSLHPGAHLLLGVSARVGHVRLDQKARDAGFFQGADGKLPGGNLDGPLERSHQAGRQAWVQFLQPPLFLFIFI